MSSNHRIKPLDLRRREPPKGYLLCRANSGNHMCGGIIEYECSFICEGPGKRHTRRLFMCERHAYAFATKHGLMMPSRQARAQKMLEVLEEKMKYQIRFKDGRVESGFSLTTVVNEARRTYPAGYAMGDDRILFPLVDLEIDDVIASPIVLFWDFPTDKELPDAYIEREDELEVTHADGIAGNPKVTVEETEDDDGLGACQGYGGGRHG